MGVCVVTGGGGPGIGSACCRALFAAGNTVWVTDVNESSARAVAAELGSETKWLRIDVADPDSIVVGIERVLDQSGNIDGLVNSAGITIRAPAAELAVLEYERMLSVNLRGPWLCARAVIPSMIENGGGSIVNIASFHAREADPSFAAYAASKAGLLALTRGIAADYGLYGIRCNSVSPGWVPTPRSSGEGAGQKNYLNSNQMLPSVIRPDDIGRAVAFLVGEESRAITAVDLTVDGGTSAMLRHSGSSGGHLP
jgi:NAD(P)-dependent dehydrogenase (short-subunit alcohol dehydrogenase family)